jgi:ligand-binding SRPBCC domain-containing protein
VPGVKIVIRTEIAAPIERCFDLARSIDLHVETQRGHAEVAVAGVTRGLIGLGQQVTWQARHFGISQKLTSRVVAFDRPKHFRDSMVQGAFRRFDHDHDFEEHAGKTVMIDVFDFESPLGPLGWLVDRLVLRRYLSRLLEDRAALIRRVAESDEWQRVVGSGKNAP